MTLLILAGGAMLIPILTRESEADREEALERARVGEPADSMTRLLGVEPTLCPVGSLAHLRGSFHGGWSEAAVYVALEALTRTTIERWVYPLNANDSVGCLGVDRLTEVGVGTTGEVVWFVAVLGRSLIVLPDTLQPAGDRPTSAQRNVPDPEVRVARLAPEES